MAIKKVRKAYERPTLVEIGSMEKTTETWGGGFWSWKWHIISKIYAHKNHGSHDGDGHSPLYPDS